MTCETKNRCPYLLNGGIMFDFSCSLTFVEQITWQTEHSHLANQCQVTAN